MAQRKSTQENTEDLFKQGAESFSENINQVSNFVKENLDAIMKSANLSFKGAEQITSKAVAASKDNIEETIAITKELVGSRSVDQAVSSHSQLSKKLLDQYVNQATELGNLFVNVSKEVLEPINQRVNAVSEQFANNNKK